VLLHVLGRPGGLDDALRHFRDGANTGNLTQDYTGSLGGKPGDALRLRAAIAGPAGDRRRDDDGGHRGHGLGGAAAGGQFAGVTAAAHARGVAGRDLPAAAADGTAAASLLGLRRTGCPAGRRLPSSVAPAGFACFDTQGGAAAARSGQLPVLAAADAGDGAQDSSEPCPCVFLGWLWLSEGDAGDGPQASAEPLSSCLFDGVDLAQGDTSNEP